MASPPSCTKDLKIGLCPSHTVSCVSHLTPGGCDSVRKPLAFDSAPLIVFMCAPLQLSHRGVLGVLGQGVSFPAYLI